MEIKRLSKCDIQGALDLVSGVFEEFVAPGYSREGVNEFSHFITFDEITGRIDRGELTLWGCFIGNEPAGVIAMKGKDHISLLFVKKEYHRRGIARKLFETASDECNQEKSLEKFTVNSSPYAVEVYRRLGFVPTGTEENVNGIRFTPMELRT